MMCILDFGMQLLKTGSNSLHDCVITCFEVHVQGSLDVKDTISITLLLDACDFTFTGWGEVGCLHCIPSRFSCEFETLAACLIVHHNLPHKHTALSRAPLQTLQ
jgi:hypothetical protein